MHYAAGVVHIVSEANHPFSLNYIILKRNILTNFIIFLSKFLRFRKYRSFPEHPSVYSAH